MVLPNASEQSTINQIKQLHDVTSEVLASLKNMNIDISSWDPMLLHIMHSPYKCNLFLRASTDKREKIIQRIKVCRNCLNTGHSTDKFSHSKCKNCNSNHNTLLCPNKPPLTLSTLDRQKNNSYILLSTAMIQLSTNNGRRIICRALLDSGSQVNLITQRIHNRLGASAQGTQHFIQGIGKSCRESKGRINLELQSLSSNFNRRMEAFVLKTIVPPQP